MGNCICSGKLNICKAFVIVQCPDLWCGVWHGIPSFTSLPEMSVYSDDKMASQWSHLSHFVQSLLVQPLYDSLDSQSDGAHNILR